MEIRGYQFYSDYEREIEFIDKIFREELTPEEAKTVAALNMQKTRLEADVKRREDQIAVLQKEIERIKSNIAQIEKRIKQYEL